MLLPKGYQFIEVLCGYRQYVARIRFASVARPDGVGPVGERELAVGAKIDDYLHVRIETMHVPGRMIHGVGRKADAVKTELTH